MDWKDLEKMTVVKLREEALNYPQITGVHGKSKETLMDELAHVLNIEKPHVVYTSKVVHTKEELKHKIHELKGKREALIKAGAHRDLHELRREIHELKRRIKRIEFDAVHKATA
jgi:transcription initiation factor IIE alpha subunit